MNGFHRLLRANVAALIAVCSVAVLAACGADDPATGSSFTSRPIYPQEMSYASRIISDFRSWRGVDGKRRSQIHQGMDVGGPNGQPIIAVADGEVIETHVEKCWGPTVAINHGFDLDGEPLIALYGHVGDIYVEEGQIVSRGDLIARLGNNHHSYKCIAGVRHLHLQLGRTRQVQLFKSDFRGHSYFLRDGLNAISPHLLWADGPYQVTCFDNNRDYPPGTITYPVPCRN